MNRGYKTRGIIIKRTNVGEADRIITIFTEDQGKIRIRAKGIRKINSRLSGNLELFCLTNFNLAEGRNLDIVTAAQIEKCFLHLRNNIQKTKEAYYFAEIVEKITLENDNHPEIFYLLLETLEFLNSIQNKLLIPYFEWKIMSIAGFQPNLNQCLNEKRKPEEKEKLGFDVEHGGIICGKINLTSIPIQADTLKILRLFLERKIKNLDKIEVPKNIYDELRRVTKNYLNSKSEKEFRSQRFI